MRRFFARNLLFVLFVNVLVKPIWIFLIDLTVQNKVGHQAYGTYQPLLNLAVIFQIVLDFGINNYNSRRLAQFPGKANQLFPAMLSARLLLSGAYILLVTGSGWLLGYHHAELLLLLNLQLIQVLGSLTQLLRSTVAGLHHFKWDGILSVADRLIMIAICGVLLWLPQTSAAFKLQWYVSSLTASAALALVISWIITQRLTGISLRLSIDVKRIANIIRQSLPFATLILLMGIYTRIDFVLIERIGGGYAGKENAGIYASGYRLLDMGNMVGMMFAGMLLPLFGRMLQQKQEVATITRLSTNVLIPFSIIAAVISIFYQEQIMHLLYTAPGTESGQVFMILMFTLPAFSLSNVYSTLLTAGGWLRQMIIIAAIGVVINMSLNVYLIPRFEAVGAAFTALTTQWIVGLLYLFAAKKAAQLPLNLRWVGSFLLYFLLVLTLGFAIAQLPVHWMVSAMLLGLLAGALVFPFGYVRPKELLALFQRQ